MVSRTKKTKATSVSTPVFQETWLPGQKEYIPQYAQTWKDIFAGNLESPTAKMLQQTTGEAAMRETAQQRRAISGTRGMTPQAKAKAMSTLGGTAVSAMAKVAQDVWGASKEFLSAYSLTPPTVASGTSSASRSTGGGGWGVCCFIFCAAGLEDPDLEIVRRHKDEHHSPDSNVAQGYKRVAGWIGPSMVRSKFIKGVIRWLMVKPITHYVKAYYAGRELESIVFYPIMRGWVSFFALVGIVFGYYSWSKYWELGDLIK
jgi:hypothetical protein